MRKNIFLHFLNRDSREIFGLPRFFGIAEHTSLLKQSLNAAMLLCEDHCVIPPGFAIEDEIAFGLSELNSDFFSEGRIVLPMREASLTDYAEKKRIEYMPQRDRYSGLFSDRRLDFLGSHAVGLVPRKSKIGEEIVSGWEAAPDSKNRNWIRVKGLLLPPAIESVRRTPALIADKGLAVTWAEIERHLPQETRSAHGELRSSLQHIYFRQYCREFGLEVLAELPFPCGEFGLPVDRQVYAFTRFAEFLAVFRLRKLLLRCTAIVICELKRKAGATRFVDAYQEIARISKSRADLLLRADNAVKKSAFNWVAFEQRHESLLAEPDGLAIAELDDALNEVASILVAQNGLPQRLEGQLPQRNASETKSVSAKKNRPPEVNSMSDLVLYVALEEELEVLVKHWSLKRAATAPIATGAIKDLAIDVLSPTTMGRVAAAVEVAKYLERRRTNKPKLILVVGLAGGFKEEGTEPGHILCGETVVDLASRKIQDKDADTVTRFRRRDFKLEPSLAAVLRSSIGATDWEKQAIDYAEWPADRRPSLHYGLVASVDEVIASDDWRHKLQGATEKLLGVEMEAGGVCAAAEAFRVPVAMLRVVSDDADPIKADTVWRRRGMKTIVTLLDHVPFDEVFRIINS